MKTSVHSEIGQLEGVIIHTPGSEVENMTPANAERALYSDILNLSIASKEYAQFEGVLKKVSKVYQVKDLLADILADEAVKKEVLNEICMTEYIDSCQQLTEASSQTLANLLVEGVVLEKNNLTNYLSNERFLLRPLHNLFFTRDSAMAMNDNMLIGKMANPVRERESVIMEAIYKYHPDIDTKILNPGKPDSGIMVNRKSMVEGGDVQIARDDIFVIGTGIRTSTQGIDFIIENLKHQKKEKHHIIVQELPETPESFIHLDMVFTFLNTDECMVYPPVIFGMSRFKTIHIEIENGKVNRIEEMPNIPKALKKLGMDLRPISCGGTGDPWIQEREQWHSGANFLAFAPGKIIGYQRNVHTIEELNKHGYDVITATDIISGKTNVDDYKKCVVTIAGSELARGGGGARCMSQPFRRAAVNW
ncbi:arginine deiminase family protein [Draconibacterium sp. IB214405]|uniref:arginine deiminase n=1 Tax=Draconibacterium sp. IB214405 TaxID=3097352 RepID=UPI002A0E5AB1|nr:arginine deiminase family protein [Draconibacterium sp. IB214405]MDX8340866.1 arginine deiminase family protein [Draconibacterium sp. IB214405]